jgi:hypothetical protein
VTASSGAPTASPARRLWVLNLDAELELERAGRSYQTPLRVAQALAPMSARARILLAPQDLCLVEPAAIGAARESVLDARGEPVTGGATAPGAGGISLAGCRGLAWCPTPTALRRLSRAGAVPAASPPLDVLHRVNHRRFYLELGGGAPGARYVADEAELAATLAQPSRAWLCKKPFGYSGRGQRRIPPAPSPDDRRWLADALRSGGFLAEPWLDLALELGVHGFIEQNGRVTLGRICVQLTDRYRAWLSTRVARDDEVSREQASALLARAEAMAAALWAAGYFGPFGIDAYLYRTASGGIALNPSSELNARFSMGFAIGLPGVPAA